MTRLISSPPNELNRFSVGTKNKDLVYGADGSLTLYVQHERPAADKVANWLRAPKGDFELFVRAPAGPAPKSCRASGRHRGWEKMN